MKGRKHVPVLVALVVVTFVLSACGGGSSSSSTGSTSHSHGSPSSKSAQVNKPSGGAEITAYGKEAVEAERETASRVLEANLKARASEDWAGQCASLSAELIKEIVERAELISGKKGTGSCPEGLEFESEPVPESVLKNPMSGPIDALRVEGSKGYALFHGADGIEYAMPMVEEGGRWRVGQLTVLEPGGATEFHE
jgi:hypothetical protein